MDCYRGLTFYSKSNGDVRVDLGDQGQMQSEKTVLAWARQQELGR